MMPPKDDETKLDLDEAQLAGVVKRMLATPPMPHGKGAAGEPKRHPTKSVEQRDNSGKKPKR